MADSGSITAGAGSVWNLHAHEPVYLSASRAAIILAGRGAVMGQEGRIQAGGSASESLSGAAIGPVRTITGILGPVRGHPGPETGGSHSVPKRVLKLQWIIRIKNRIGASDKDRGSPLILVVSVGVQYPAGLVRTSCAAIRGICGYTATTGQKGLERRVHGIRIIGVQHTVAVGPGYGIAGNHVADGLAAYCISPSGCAVVRYTR